MLEDGSVVPQQTETGYNLVVMIPSSDPQLADEYIVVIAGAAGLLLYAGGSVTGTAQSAAAAAESSRSRWSRR